MTITDTLGLFSKDYLSLQTQKRPPKRFTYKRRKEAIDVIVTALHRIQATMLTYLKEKYHPDIYKLVPVVYLHLTLDMPYKKICSLKRKDFVKPFWLRTGEKTVRLSDVIAKKIYRYFDSEEEKFNAFNFEKGIRSLNEYFEWVSLYTQEDLISMITGPIKLEK